MSTARRKALRTSVATCALLTLLSGAACSTAGGTPGTVASSPVALPAPSFGGTDLAWVEITIAMNEQLLPLLDLTPTLSENARVKAMSAEVRAGHEAELKALRALHDQAGLSPVNPHKGMPMPGMVTPEQVVQAESTRGTAFDTLLLSHLRAHLDQGIRLATSEGQAGTEAATLTLAETVRSDREKLKKTLSALSR